MRFAIINRFNAMRWIHKDPFIHISISDSDQSACVLTDCPTRLDQLFMFFEDWTYQDPHQPNYVLFNEDMAKEILDFVNGSLAKHPDLDLIVVNCQAGISRSSAVAAALATILNGRDDFIFRDPAFAPNMLVYHTILRVHFGRGSAFGEIES